MDFSLVNDSQCVTYSSQSSSSSCSEDISQTIEYVTKCGEDVDNTNLITAILAVKNGLMPIDAAAREYHILQAELHHWLEKIFPEGWVYLASTKTLHPDDYSEVRRVFDAVGGRYQYQLNSTEELKYALLRLVTSKELKVNQLAKEYFIRRDVFNRLLKQLWILLQMKGKFSRLILCDYCCCHIDTVIDVIDKQLLIRRVGAQHGNTNAKHKEEEI